MILRICRPYSTVRREFVSRDDGLVIHSHISHGGQPVAANDKLTEVSAEELVFLNSPV
jgi:hypothetical protein